MAAGQEKKTEMKVEGEKKTAVQETFYNCHYSEITSLLHEKKEKKKKNIFCVNILSIPRTRVFIIARLS